MKELGAKMEEVSKFAKKKQKHTISWANPTTVCTSVWHVAHIFEGKLYDRTGQRKDVLKATVRQPKAELCAFKKMAGVDSLLASRED